jgi:hypothetical protein
VVLDFLLDTVEFGERFLSIGRDLVALSWIVAVGEVRCQRIDSTLQRFSERLSTLGRLAFSLDALLPVRFILLRLALLTIVGRLLCVISRLLGLVT